MSMGDVVSVSVGKLKVLDQSGKQKIKNPIPDAGMGLIEHLRNSAIHLRKSARKFSMIIFS
jgi:hypothetical protein